MDLAELIAIEERAIAAAAATRASHVEQQNALLDTIKSEGRNAPNEQEQARFDAASDAKRALDTDITARSARVDSLRAEDAADKAAAALGEQRKPAVDKPAYDKVARVGQEPRTYTVESAKDGVSFFTDAWLARKGSGEHAGRIERHGREVLVERELSQRALATGGIAGLAVPQYLVDMAALVLRAGRPFANVCNHHELPDQGMTLIIPRGTTGATAAEQATENSAVSNTDEVYANLNVPVVTVAAQQDVSRQTLERGTGMDGLIYADLARAHAARLDFLLINGTGASGQPFGLVNTAGIGAGTAFGAVPGAANLTLKVAGAVTGVASAGAGVMARLLLMHPRRWGFLTGLVDSSNRPIVIANQMGPFNASALINEPGKISADGSDYGLKTPLIIGTHSSGLPVVTDLNVPTTVGTNVEDLIFALDTAECHLWEDGDGMPRQLEFEQTTGGSLTTKLVVYSYIAFTAGRYPAAVYKVGGLDTVATQGLVAPSF